MRQSIRERLFVCAKRIIGTRRRAFVMYVYLVRNSMEAGRQKITIKPVRFVPIERIEHSRIYIADERMGWETCT